MSSQVMLEAGPLWRERDSLKLRNPSLTKRFLAFAVIRTANGIMFHQILVCEVLITKSHS